MEKQFKITVNGTAYDVVVEDLSSPADQFMPNYAIGSMPATASVVAAPAAPAPAAAPVAAGAGDQCAQMGGVVATILVSQGQAVNSGDKIMEVEAMKMKMPVIASCSGKVSAIKVAVGDAVIAGQVLLVIS